MPPDRLRRWCENFTGRHGETTFSLSEHLQLAAADGSTASVALPLRITAPEIEVGGDPVGAFEVAACSEVRWGVLLVRKGGFAVAAGTSDTPLVSKVGQRHVQGRTKAGGQSQQRFARRRGNQARQAYEAAAGHAHRVLVTEFGGVHALVCGGDRGAVDAVLEDPRLSRLVDVRTGPWLPVPDPRRDVLNQAIADAHSLQIEVDDRAE